MTIYESFFSAGRSLPLSSRIRLAGSVGEGETFLFSSLSDVGKRMVKGILFIFFLNSSLLLFERVMVMMIVCRWLTYLNAECKKGGWSQEEDMLLCEVRGLLSLPLFAIF